MHIASAVYHEDTDTWSVRLSIGEETIKEGIVPPSAEAMAKRPWAPFDEVTMMIVDALRQEKEEPGRWLREIRRGTLGTTL